MDEKPRKVYRGAYTYSLNGAEYAEESFEVFKDYKELTYRFISQIISRVSTGELLKVDVDYLVGKEWTPIEVKITKNLGKQTVTEHYQCDNNRNLITYTFTDSDGKVDSIKKSCPPRFSIATPSASSNFIFLLSKKFDINGKNYYAVYNCDNQWEYKSEIYQTTLELYKDGPSSEPLKIGKTSLQGDEYILTTSRNDEKDDEVKKIITVYISKHKSIPYRINDSSSGLNILVKYLNNLDPEA